MTEPDERPIGTMTVAEIVDSLDDRDSVPVLIVAWVQRGHDGDVNCVHVSAGDDTEAHHELVKMVLDCIHEFEQEDQDDTEKDPQQ